MLSLRELGLWQCLSFRWVGCACDAALCELLTSLHAQNLSLMGKLTHVTTLRFQSQTSAAACDSSCRFHCSSSYRCLQARMCKPACGCRSHSSSNEGSLAPSPRTPPLELVPADRGPAGSLPRIVDWPAGEAAGHQQPRVSRERDFATLFPPSDTTTQWPGAPRNSLAPCHTKFCCCDVAGLSAVSGHTWLCRTNGPFVHVLHE